jgi:clorobiocin biosynthesis protein CloN4
VNQNLHDLVVAAARRDPTAPAVADADGTLSYGGLDGAADRYARALRARGIRPGQRILIWGGKSAEMVALMQGALRAGVVYVPVTAANPAVRVASIARDCTAALVAVDEETAAAQAAGGLGVGGLGAGGLGVGGLGAGGLGAGGLDGGGLGPDAPALVALTELGAEGERGNAPAEPVHRADPGDLAYILYTSGSTGTPKGVSISHRNALAFVTWAGDLLQITGEDRLANHAPFNFDLSVFDLYAAFAAGASVHLVQPELAYTPAQLTEYIEAERISIWYSVPSALVLMMRDGGLLDRPRPPALRACVFAGEPFPVPQVQALRKHWQGVRMFNWYGPTETNVCTSYEVTDADLARVRPLPIGTAASGDTVLLDPPGEGEIVVDGPTVMLGYWGGPAHSGPYRTGDLGRVGEDGGLEYVGRLDHMVKVRGQRIELGEIEAVLGGHESIASVAVLVRGSGLESMLHAVIVPAPGHRPSLLGIKVFAAARLPTYMVPDVLHLTAGLPLTPNGKTDRTALAAAIERGEI